VLQLQLRVRHVRHLGGGARRDESLRPGGNYEVDPAGR
jgi:hypothetical protein